MQPAEAEMSAESLMKMKSDIDASFLSSFRSHLSSLPFHSSSSSDGSDESTHTTGEEDRTHSEPKRKKRKKIESFLENLLSQVIRKQEQMHQQLIELIQSKERERILREKEWHRQEMEWSKRELQVSSQETAQNLALISFIHAALGGQQLPSSFPSALPKRDEGDTETSTQGENNKRWPVSEVQALITLRAALDHKFNHQAYKTPVWQEVSAAMAAMGFTRCASKCREKWGNINKYYKRVISSGKDRSENAKSCPYFHELETLYNNKLITDGEVYSPCSDNAEEDSKV